MNNTFLIKSMNHPRDVSVFLKRIQDVLEKHEEIDIYFQPQRVYPCACVPISGIIQYFRKKGKKISCHYGKNSFLSTINFNLPYKVSEHLESLAFPYNKVWRFNDFDEVAKLVDAFTKELSSLVRCSYGLIEGLTWSLNETMDNVLQHSLSNEGYIMGVVHQSTQYIMFTIYDSGQGIFNSLRDSQYHPRNAVDAITLAIQEGKTRDKSIGQGNGLWGLNNIILNNQGKLTITSHGSALMIRNDGTSAKFSDLPVIDSKDASTAVDVSFNYQNNISVVDVIGGYVPFDARFDSLQNDSNGIDFILKDEANGFGTRIAGERVRNQAMNYLHRYEAPQCLEIDFEGISIISSSFADEFIGKMLAEFGFIKFNQIVRLKNMNPTVEAIINRSVGQRMAVLYKANT